MNNYQGVSGMDVMAEYNFVSKYPKYIEKLQRRETFEEANDRVLNMHLDKYVNVLRNDNPKRDILEGIIRRAFDLVKEKKLLGSQRMLQFGGEGVVKHNPRGFNCAFSYCDRPRFFSEALYLLLCGVGCGFSVQDCHVEQLPELQFNPLSSINTFVIEDSIEGWAEALNALVNHYFNPRVGYLKFDYSQIRESGAPLSTGGKAPGPEPLGLALENIEGIFQQAVDNGQQKLTPIQCHDIVCYASDCVLAGGVRRCLAGTDDVITDKGSTLINEVLVGDLVLTGDSTFQRVVAKVNNGRRQLQEIRTNLGILYSTPEHRWAVAKDMFGTVDWVRADELNKNDCLVINTRLIEGNYQDFPKDEIYTPPRLDNRTAWFLGYFFGNGSVFTRVRSDNGYLDNKFRVSAPTNYCGIAGRVNKLFNLFVDNKSTHDKGTSLEITSSRSDITNYFLQFKQPGFVLQIPRFIRENTASIRAAFLSGLLDSDGSVRNQLTEDRVGTGQISLVSTKYCSFAREVQALYFSLGVPTKLDIKTCDDKSDEYIVKTISSEFRHKAVVMLMPHSYKINFDWIDYECGKEMYGVFYPKGLSKVRGDKTYIWNSNDSISREKVKRYFDNSLFVPAVVVSSSTSDISEETFDIEVENNHNFYSQGALTHNSALISLFSSDDEEMVNAKVGNWNIESPQRARANNTAVLLRNEDNLHLFKKLMKAAREFGEPGFMFVDNVGIGTNPCAEVSLCPTLIKGPEGNVVESYTNELLDLVRRDEWVGKGYTFESGWEFCNLVSLDASKFKSRGDFKEATWAGAVIGTLQAGYTDPGYLTEATRLINEREALLGVSLAGIMENANIALDYNLQREMALYACEVNREIAGLIGIRSAARVTCEKPDGNTSVILKTSSGIHPHHSRRYIRRVQATKNDPVYKYFKEHNPHMCEESVWSANKTDDVVAFPVEVDEKAIVKEDLGALDFLNIVLNTQQNWVKYGTARPESVISACHNVSNTVLVSKPEEWMDVGKFIYQNKDYFTAVSVVGGAADYVYPQAPMQQMVFEDELVLKYGSANVGAARHLHRHIEHRFGALQSILRPLKMVLEGYPSDEAVEGLEVHAELLWDTYKKIRQLIHVEDPDDIIFLLSAINHEHLWHELLDNMVSVDYSGLVELKDNTKQLDQLACSGGICEIL